MKRPGRPLRIILLVLLGVMILVAAGIFFSTRYLETEIRKKLSLNHASASEIDVQVLSRAVQLKNFKWNPGFDSTLLDSAVLSKEVIIKDIRVSGIRIIPFLRHKRFGCKRLTIDGGSVAFPIHSKSGDQEKKDPQLTGISFDDIEIADLHVTLYEDSITRYSAMINLKLDEAELSDLTQASQYKAYSIKEIDGRVDDLRINDGPNYHFRIDNITLNTLEHTLTADCVFVIPNYGKVEFGRKIGKQTTRVDMVMPRIEVSNLSYHVEVNDSLVVVAGKLLIIKPSLAAFRDKRVPFRRKEEMPLPMKVFRDLPIAIEVDSIQLREAEIVYEHWGENSFRSGTISFTHLNGDLGDLHNRPYNNKPSYSVLKATSQFLDGKIVAAFTLPLDPKMNYKAKGKISDVKLRRLNTILENAAFVKIESGVLSELNFEFDYNNEGSKGAVDMNYDGLRITTLTKERHPSKMVLKSFVVNSALKKEVNGNNLTGKIDTKRDKKRAVFHLWAHSLIDGVKSAVSPVPMKK